MCKASKGLFLCSMLVVGAFTAAEAVGQPIAWRSRTAKAGAQAATADQVLDESRGRHAVVQFDAIPDDARRDQLASAGVTLLDYLGDHAFFASVAEDGLTSKDAGGLGVAWAAPGSGGMETTSDGRFWQLPGLCPV